MPGGCWGGLWLRGWKGSGAWHLSKDTEGVSLPEAAGLGVTGLLWSMWGQHLACTCKPTRRGGRGWDPSETWGGGVG